PRHIRKIIHLLVNRQVKDDSEKQACHHNRLSANFIGQPTKVDKQRCAQNQRHGQDVIRLNILDVARLLNEGQRVKLSGIPYNTLSGGGAKQRDQHVLQVFFFSKAFLDRISRHITGCFEFREQRRLLHSQTDVNGNGNEKDTEEKRKSPSPRRKRFFGKIQPNQEDYSKRNKQTKRSSSLNEAGIKTSLRGGRMFRNIRCGTA